MRRDPAVVVRGDADLPLILHFHSPGAFPVEVDGLAPMAAQVGVRVLGAEREAIPAEAFGSVAELTGAVIDFLGPQLPGRFGVLGWSGGAPFALAAAALFPQLVERAVVACPLPGWLRGAGSVPASTARLAAIAEGDVPGPAAPEMNLLADAWGFELESISVPLLVWYSADDPIIPAELIERQLAHLPTSELRRFTGGGHYLPMGRWDELLREAMPRSGNPPSTGPDEPS